MAKRKITIETLAGMIQRGFGEMAKKHDRIEKLILADHKRRIERLEDQVKDLRDLLAIK